MLCERELFVRDVQSGLPRLDCGAAAGAAAPRAGGVRTGEDDCTGGGV